MTGIELLIANVDGVITVNGYSIRWNDMWKEWQISHPEIGANVAEFQTLGEAIDHVYKG